MDWTTGKEVGRTELVTSPNFNTNGGFFILLDNGDLLLTGAFGAVRISQDQESFDRIKYEGSQLR